MTAKRFESATNEQYIQPNLFTFHYIKHTILKVEFRWFWMTSKFQEELQGCDKRTTSNHYPFVLPVTIPCTHQNLSQFFSTPFDAYEVSSKVFSTNYNFLCCESFMLTASN